MRACGTAAAARRLAVSAVAAAALAAVLAAAVSCGAGGATYTFRLANRDTMALDSAYVAGGELEARFGTVPASGEARARVVVRRDVILHLDGLRGERPFRFWLGGYVSRGPDAEVALTVTPGPALQVGAATPR
jgi:hypothetical protein